MLTHIVSYENSEYRRYQYKNKFVWKSCYDTGIWINVDSEKRFDLILTNSNLLETKLSQNQLKVYWQN
jgi:hypothetical protein